jgi:hypothetical protein
MINKWLCCATDMTSNDKNKYTKESQIEKDNYRVPQ